MVDNMKFRGRHSEVYVEGCKAVKVFKPQFKYNFWKEVRYLTILQRRGFVPKIYRYNPRDLTVEMEFVNGLKIREFVKERDFDEVVEVLKACMDICFYLDRMRVQKGEMNRPDRHIIVSDRIVFIDFERACENPKPSNVTQFLEYIMKVTDLSVEREFIYRYKRSFMIRDYNILRAMLFKPYIS